MSNCSQQRESCHETQRRHIGVSAADGSDENVNDEFTGSDESSQIAVCHSEGERENQRVSKERRERVTHARTIWS